MLNERKLFGKAQRASAICEIYRDFKEYCEKELKNYELDGGLYFFLLYIYKHPGRTYSDLAEHIQSDKGHTSRGLQRLEMEGYIFLESDPKKMEDMKINITPKGEITMEEIKNIFENWEDIVFQNLSSEERILILDLLRKVETTKSEI